MGSATCFLWLLVATCFVSVQGQECTPKNCFDLFDGPTEKCDDEMSWSEARRMCQEYDYDLCDEHVMFGFDEDVEFHDVWSKTKCSEFSEHSIVSSNKQTSYCLNSEATKAKVFCCKCEGGSSASGDSSGSGGSNASGDYDFSGKRIFGRVHGLAQSIFGGSDHRVRNTLLIISAVVILIGVLIFCTLSYKSWKKVKKTWRNLKKRIFKPKVNRMYSDESTASEEGEVVVRSKKQKKSDLLAKKKKARAISGSMEASATRRESGSRKSRLKKPKDSRRLRDGSKKLKKSRKFKATEEEQEIMIQIDSE